jgi:para-aminobenzoate synthetase / 4-amino-4-deoxychorismate lyase
MYYGLPLQQCFAFVKRHRPCVLLDTASADRDNTQSFVFTGPVENLVAKKREDVSLLFQKIDASCGQYWVAGFLSYEAAYAFEEKLDALPWSRNVTTAPLLGWFGVFHDPFIFDHTTGQWNKSLPQFAAFAALKNNTEYPPRPPTVKNAVSLEGYANAIRSIKRYIARGHTYQINFTFDVFVEFGSQVIDLYCALRNSQAAAYCAFVNTGDSIILSFSPELFFRKKGRHIVVKPMKGTAPRGRYFQEDKRVRKALSRDLKNRSENIMIVDLMRNDLGKICEIGSINVSRLFAIETLRTVHQMTSTVKGRLQAPMPLSKIFRSLFPSGSVTGAPKIRSMEIIKSLETGFRGAYCGALGYINPLGNAVFSVPIRTFQNNNKIKSWKFRVGSGIVWDSKISDEWRECAVKCDFFTAALPDFEIFESLLWKNDFLYVVDHIERLHDTARYFKYPLDRLKLISVLKSLAHSFEKAGSQKVRIFLDKNGIIRWDYAPIEDLSSRVCARVFVSRKPMDPLNPFLFNKTTFKPWYSQDAEKIRKGLCFDVIHVNSRQEVTEGSRCNIFMRKGSMLFTPPIDCGLLPGVLRKNLLRRKNCSEAILKVSDLKKADAVYCGNSVRGLVEVKIHWKSPKGCF